jgi:hypothetical protein
MTTQATPFETVQADTADERWAQWVARGAEQDSNMQKRFISLAVVLSFGLAGWFTIMLMLR